MSATPAGAGGDSARLAAIRRAQAAWIAQLVDLGGRNTLLYYRDLKVGTLDLGPGSPADPVAVEQLLASRALPLTTLFGPEARVDTAKRARALSAKAAENFEERGLRTLFLAWGMATWTNERSASTPAAPVLLRQADLKPRGRAEENFELSLPGEWEINPTLLYALRSEHQVDLVSDELLTLFGTGGVRSDPDPSFPDPLFARLTKAAEDVPGFAVVPRVVLGNFSYAKWEMVKDIENGLDALLASDLLCAIAGHEPAQQAVRDRQVTVEMSAPDKMPPAREMLVLDADASQSYAINAAAAGADLVVEGPPGTGKSQTIANLIASLAGEGRTVLFVAEKRAAIDAVLHRLNNVGLGDLVLDLHDGLASKRRLAQDLARSLADMATTGRPQTAAADLELTRRRADLIAHDQAMHGPRQPWGRSVYELQCDCLAMSRRATTAFRFRSDQLQELGDVQLDQARQSLRRFVSLGGLRAMTMSPWAPALNAGTIPTASEAQHAFTTLHDVRTRAWPYTAERLRRLLEECGLQAPGTLATPGPPLCASLTAWRRRSPCSSPLSTPSRSAKWPRPLPRRHRVGPGS